MGLNGEIDRSLLTICNHGYDGYLGQTEFPRLVVLFFPEAFCALFRALFHAFRPYVIRFFLVRIYTPHQG